MRGSSGASSSSCNDYKSDNPMDRVNGRGLPDFGHGGEGWNGAGHSSPGEGRQALDLWKVTETACDALNNVAYRNADNQAALLELGVLPACLALLARHNVQGNESVSCLHAGALNLLINMADTNRDTGRLDRRRRCRRPPTALRVGTPDVCSACLLLHVTWNHPSPTSSSTAQSRPSAPTSLRSRARRGLSDVSATVAAQEAAVVRRGGRRRPERSARARHGGAQGGRGGGWRGRRRGRTVTRLGADAHSMMALVNLSYCNERRSSSARAAESRSSSSASRRCTGARPRPSSATSARQLDNARVTHGGVEALLGSNDEDDDGRKTAYSTAASGPGACSSCCASSPALGRCSSDVATRWAA